jgi:hypothetical protein
VLIVPVLTWFSLDLVILMDPMEEEEANAMAFPVEVVEATACLA